MHPRYLDRMGLLALWREALLAQKVLRGETRGYRHHPQLARFRELVDPLAGIASYLVEVHAEAERRGYRFDGGKIAAVRQPEQIAATRGQLTFELEHLRRKLTLRDPAKLAELVNQKATEMPQLHPLFHLIDGAVAPWERL